jgi:hypothetical protein
MENFQVLKDDNERSSKIMSHGSENLNMAWFQEISHGSTWKKHFFHLDVNLIS